MFKNLSDNLNILMAKAKLNSSELGRLTGLPPTTIKRIRNNEQSNPTIGTLLPIAQHFSINISELLGCELIHAHEKGNISHFSKSIPHLSWHECLHFQSLNFEKFPRKVVTEKKVSEKCYALSLEKHDLDFFPENCMLLVEPDRKPESGDYVIIGKATASEGVASIKKYVIETDQPYLKSLVSGLGILPLTEDYLILGVIIQYKVELKR